jgi:catechol 2,3-dioxygenase-like lactoylglutathione lyase family enzyme
VREMMNRFPVYPVLPASDIGRAKAWYQQKLGMSPSREGQSGLWYQCGEGTWLLVYPTDSAGTARNTQAHFQVMGIEEVTQNLRGRGVEFEHYEAFKDFQSEDGIIEMEGYKVVFVKDSEGNTIEIAEPPTEG